MLHIICITHAKIMIIKLTESSIGKVYIVVVTMLCYVKPSDDIIPPHHLMVTLDL